MAQILPLTNPSMSAGGRSAHWHCSWDSKPCLPCRHSFTFCMSSTCSLVACLSKGFGGVLQCMATQGCCRNVRFATKKSSWDSARLIPCTSRLRNSLSTLNVMNSMNCTPSNHLYTLVTPDNLWQVPSFTPMHYPPPRHISHRISESDVPMFPGFLWKQFACHVEGTSESGNSIFWEVTLTFHLQRRIVSCKFGLCGMCKFMLSCNSPGVGCLDPHIMAHILTIYCGLPSPSPAFESSLASG